MRVVVAGAYGFIGQAITKALLAAGHEVIGAGRDLDHGRRTFPHIDWIKTDFNKDLNPALWQARLEKLGAPVDAVVNAVGILQSDLRDNAFKIHGAGARAFFEGAVRAGVTRLIHISATTIEPHGVESGDITFIKDGAVSDYAASKIEGEAYLSALAHRHPDIKTAILRPSLVIGPGSTGGALLLKGLAGLAFFTPLPGDGAGQFQPVLLDDLSASVARLLDAPVESWPEGVIYAVGPEVLSLEEIVAAFRNWLGFGAARVIRLPKWVMKPLLWLGDFSAYFGNRSSFRSTAMKQMAHFTHHEGETFAYVLGRPAESLRTFFASAPPTLADRQEARLFFWLPFFRWVMGLSFLLFGVIGVLQIAESGWDYVLSGVGEFLFSLDASVSVVAGGLILSSKWVRIGGALKIVALLITGLYGLFFVAGVAGFIGGVLGILFPILTIAVLMALSERR